jgi:hypothetical protein
MTVVCFSRILQICFMLSSLSFLPFLYINTVRYVHTYDTVWYVLVRYRNLKLIVTVSMPSVHVSTRVPLKR